MWEEFQLGGYDQQQFEWVQQTCLAVCPKQEQSYTETKQPQLTLVCLLFKSWTVTTHTQRNGVRQPQFLLFLLELFLFDLEMITEMHATFGWFSDTMYSRKIALCRHS